MPVTRAVPARRPKDRKAKIALAAAGLFCRHGYHNVGIDDIAAEVGITGPAVYRHFSGKQAILAHATRQLYDAVESAIDAADGPDAPEDRLEQVTLALARLSIERRAVGALYQWERRHLDAADRAELGERLRRSAERVSTLLRECGHTDGVEPRAWAALSALASVCTHRAAIPKERGERLLQRVALALLTAGPPPSRLPASPPRPRLPASTSRSVTLTPRREALLAAAAQLFRRNGYHGVSIEDIGAAVGINGSSVYRHFPSKGGLLAAIYYRATERLGAATATTLDQLVENFVDLTFSQGDLVMVYLSEHHNLPARDRHELRRAQRLYVDEWARQLAKGDESLGIGGARVVVHAAFNVIIDLARFYGHDLASGEERRLVAHLALVALHVGAPVRGLSCGRA